MLHTKLKWEAILREQGFDTILGVDEVGTGPIAGPVVAGCAELVEPSLDLLERLRDSKQLSANARAGLIPLIQQHTACIGETPAKLVDMWGLGPAISIAMCTAIGKVLGHISLRRDVGRVGILLDGSIDRITDELGHPNVKVFTIVKGDQISASIMAAAILAKEYRDEYMRDVDRAYPEYKFKNHVGYGTDFHAQALNLYGPCPEHRSTWLKALMTYKKRHARGLV